uniref:SSD domain-containing protein n=1 Tax=Caenorhabditis japonica TaxID=281687 RepID=A0A8R1HMU2_CAEJA
MILGPSLGHIGDIIGTRPWVWFIISFLLGCSSLTSLYLNPPSRNLAFEAGYTTPNAPSIREIKAQKDFFTGGKEGNPWYAALFIEPRDKSRSVHTGREFNELKQFYNKVKNVPIRYEKSLDRNITYYDLCGSTCDLNNLLFTTESLSFFGLSYPVTSLLMYKSNIGKHFYEVETTEDGTLKSAKVAMLVFMAFYQTKETKSDLSLYEVVVQKIVDEFNGDQNNSVTITLHSEKGMSIAVSSGMEHAFKYLGVGVALSALVLFGVLLFFSKIFCQFTLCRIVLLWLVAIFVPVFSFTSALFIYNVLGYSITPLTIFTPFLALIHGYSTVIMLTHTWLSDTELRRDSPNEHLLEVFATCMPSLVVTASPAIAFIICIVYPIANYAAAAFLIGLIMSFVLLFSMFLFSPAMLIICPAVNFSPIPTTSNVVYTRTKPILRKIEQARDWYCHYVYNSSFVKFFAIFGILALLIVPLYIGFTSVEANLDYRQLLRRDSPKSYGVHLMNDVVWPTWFSIMFFVNKPPTFSNPNQYSRFKSMMSEIERIPNKLPSDTDMVWINDFCRHTNSQPSDDALNMTQFKGFIEDTIYKSWKDGVKFEFGENATEPVITNMLHIASFRGTTSLAAKAKLFEKGRIVTNKYPEFETTLFDTEIGFADIIVQVPPVITVIPLVSFVLMFIISAIIIGNLSVALLNFLFVFLLYSSTIGFISLFGIAVNPFNAAFFLVIAALTPNFTTHFCYYYQQAMRINSKAEKSNRLNEMLRKCFFPCISTVACWLAVFLPSLFCDVDIFQSVAVTNVTFCCVGVALAFFVQVFLNMLPDMFTGTHWFCST